MPLQRRTFLKTMALSAFCNNLAPTAFAYAGPFYYIFLHGLFFLEAKDMGGGKTALEIKAPKITGHVLLGGSRRNLSKIDDVDFTKTSDLPFTTPTPGSPIPKDIKPSILQFTKSETGVGSLATFNLSNYLGRITLPWPKEFFSLRAATFPYPTPQKSAVVDKIKVRCGSNEIGTVTCLQYQYKIPGSYHVHLLACSDETVCHVNQALKEAQSVFQNPAKFDFYVPSEMQATPVDDPAVPGAVREDENSEKEDEPTKWKDWCKGVSKPNIICMENVSPANCPLFFVG